MITAPVFANDFNKKYLQVTEEINEVKSFGQPITNIEGWNHVSSFPDEFVELNNKKRDYNIVHSKLDKQGSNQVEISTILVKKLIDTTRQHSNGIKLLFTGQGITIGNFDKLSFKLKIDHAQLQLPKLDNTLGAYQLDLKQQIAVRNLFDDRAYLNFTLFGGSADDQKIKSIFASKIISLLSKSNGNDYFTVEINSEDFEYYWQQQWQKSYVIKQDVMTQKIFGVLITAETNNGKTLRHYLSKRLPAIFEEKFIEIPISIKNPSVFVFNR